MREWSENTVDPIEYADVLDAVLAEEGITAPAGAVLTRGDAADAPLSFAQRRVWFFEQWLPGTPTYNVGSAFWVDGPLDPALLQRALRLTVARHEVLHSRYTERDGEPVQIPVSDVDLTVVVRDHGGLPEAEREPAALAEAQAEVRRPFDLGGGLPVRALLLTLEPARHLLVLTVHHIAFDGWSMDLLLTDLDTAYRGLLAGAAEHDLLPVPALQYKDFAAWERNRWDSGELAGQVGYWRERLAGAPALLDLPTDRPRPVMQTFGGRTHTMAVPPEIATALRDFCAAHGTTEFTVLLAAFDVLLARYSGSEDLVVATPVAVRDRTELEGLVGLLVNTVALRTDLGGDPAFTEVLRRVRDGAAEAFDHADLPFERLVNELKPARELAHSPIAQVVFGLQDQPAARRGLGPAALRNAYVERGTAKFDLTWSVLAGAGLDLEIEYNHDLFDEATVTRMAGHYLRVLHGLLADPGLRVSEVDLLGTDERALLSGLARGAAFPAEQTLPGLVDRWVAEMPEAVAVTCEGASLSYVELDRRANRLAGHLRANGVGPESIVGVCLPRGLDLVVSLLAVLKAGGAYLPLDPAYPQQRLSYLLTDAGARLVVTAGEVRDRLPGGPWPVVDLTADAAAIDALPAQTPEPLAGPDNLAYVIYTSGSTGEPKGVTIPHRNVVRLLTATADWFGFGARDTWTLFHSYAFDFSVWELWGALGTGGRLVVVPHLVSRSPEAFRALLATERVTVLNQTPSAFRSLVEADRQASDPLTLRLVIFGGEALDLASVARWYERHGDTEPRLVNMYGITETTVHVTYRPLDTGDLDAGSSPIGVTIADLRAHVLDRWGNQVPLGVPGELFVGGAGLARGYLGRPGLTAERFLPDPFGTEPGARLYRTGDLTRYTVDGQLEYLGRNDDQVKVRGFRIETGEIEAALAGHPAVRATTVLARKDGAAPARLVAYLVSGAEHPPSVDELRGHLGALLPEYMVPAVFVFLDELPVTGNGKVDRAALPEPEAVRPELAQAYVAPDGPVQEQLAAVWAEVLDVDRVGVHDSFFDLGGDSIRSLQILGLARSRGLEFTLQDLFRSPTIAGLAEVTGQVAVRETVREPFSLVAAADRAKLPEGLADAYPMSVLQAGMVYHMQLDTENLPYHNVNSFHLRARFDAELFARAVQDVVARHAVLRTAFDLGSFSQPMQLVYPEATLPIEVYDLRELDEQAQDRALLDVLHDERHRPFDLTVPPFLRYLLHRRTEDTFQWTVTEHHAIFDGWSLFSTQAEVLRRYLLLLDDPDAPAEAPPVSAFRDFIELEQEALTEPEHKKYWLDTLAGYTPVTLPELPSSGGMSAPAEEYDSAVHGEVEGEVRQWRFTSTRNATHRSLEALIPIEVCDRLIALGAKSGTPFKSVLLAAHMKVMSLVTGETDVVTGLTAHGRPEDIDSTEVRGMFLNVPPIRVDTSGGSWAELVHRVFRAEEDLLPHRRYPLARMQWDLGNVQLFDNTFLYNHFHVMQDVIGAGVEILDDRIESTTEYRAEPTSFALSTGFLRNPNSAQLLLRLDYYTEKLTDEQAEAIRGYYLAVLGAMADAPAELAPAEHEAFSPLEETERRQVLREWQGPARDYPVGDCVHELVHRQALRTPDAIAVLDDEVELTYAELDRRSTRLARHLRSLGAGPESVVGVCVERDAELVVTLLGVLKSGAAYLPLDPAYPADRLRFLLTDAGAGLVLTREKLAGRVPEGSWRVCATDTAAAEIDRQDDGDLGRTSHPDNLAYVIYTSGSTGTPKGVQVPHFGVVNYLGWCVEGYASRGSGGAALFSSFAFDMIVPNLYTPLIMGERVCVLPESTDPGQLGRRLEALAPFNFIKMTPGHLDLLSQSLGQAGARRLAGTLAVGADAFPSRNLANWRRLDTETPVLNEYGPTEASVGNCVYHTEGPVDRDLLPIGRAIPNTTMYVLDHTLNPAPVGVPGELYIGGDCVVRGYAGRPGLTADRFLPDPFDGRPGARMYRTGDLGRWLPGGNLDFLGRVDEQVKINGYRVELGEIEVVLAGHPAVARSVAAVLGKAQHERRLVGYYVPATGSAQEPPVTAEELQDYLAERLPGYLVPATLLAIDSIPLNANGKVDRKALPDPRELRQRSRQDNPGPRTPLEELLGNVWSELLGTAEFGVRDNFFALGGNSLLATQMAFRVGAALGIDAGLSLVLGTRTLAELADRLGDEVLAVHGEEVAAVLRQPAEGPR